jgi:AmmeMemoRadiSam system protein B
MVLAFCDGTRDAKAMATAFTLHYGMMLPVTRVQELLTALDEAILLDNERAAQARAETLATYRNAPFRPPTLAGLSYPAEPERLWRLLQDYLEAAESSPIAVDWSSAVGLLSPHIDYPRGGAVYANVWKRCTQAAQEADLVIMFGTDHYGADPFTLTRQNYATPYGTLPTEQTVVDALADVLGEEAAFAGEFRHRGEHSLELVAVWLHHLRAGKPVAVVPLLVGGFQQFIQNGATPAQDQLIEQVLQTIRTAAQGRRVLVVASGDLAHVGPAFGGAPLDAAGRTALRAADDELIGHMRAGDADGFFAAIRKVSDRNNVCGLAPIYLTLRTLGAVRGEPAGYAVCPADERGTSVVTVGGMMFY